MMGEMASADYPDQTGVFTPAALICTANQTRACLPPASAADPCGHRDCSASCCAVCCTVCCNAILLHGLFRAWTCATLQHGSLSGNSVVPLRLVDRRKATVMGDASPGPHVLLIDDSQVLRDLFQRFLAQAGYRVTVSPLPLNKARLMAVSPEVIVLDVLAAGGQAIWWEYLTLLRRDPDTAGIPVVLCTTAESLRHNPPMAATLQRLGVRVLHKPIPLTQLVTAITEAFATSVPRDQVPAEERRSPGVDVPW